MSRVNKYIIMDGLAVLLNFAHKRVLRILNIIIISIVFFLPLIIFSHEYDPSPGFKQNIKFFQYCILFTGHK